MPEHRPVFAVAPDVLRRQVAILDQYECAEDRLFHACAMAGITVDTMRDHFELMRYRIQRCHVSLLLRLTGMRPQEIMTLTSKGSSFDRLAVRAWREAGGDMELAA